MMSWLMINHFGVAVSSVAIPMHTNGHIPCFPPRRHGRETERKMQPWSILTTFLKQIDM